MSKKIVIAGMSATGLLTAAGLGYLFVTSKKDIKKGMDAQKGISALAIDEAKATINVQSASNIANFLHKAMKGFGTKEKEIYKQLSNVRNQNDLLLIIKAFGLREYKGDLKKIPVNLNVWFMHELSGKALKTVQAVYAKCNVPF